MGQKDREPFEIRTEADTAFSEAMTRWQKAQDEAEAAHHALVAALAKSVIDRLPEESIEALMKFQSAVKKHFK
jgi:hypothetical protein